MSQPKIKNYISGEFFSVFSSGRFWTTVSGFHFWRTEKMHIYLALKPCLAMCHM